MDAFLTVMLFATMVVESPASVQETCTRSRCACHVPITVDQQIAIDEFQSSLVNMSSEELEDIVYNRTTPVIELTEDQEKKLLARYPAYFRVANSSGDSIDTPHNGNLDRRKRSARQAKLRVCPSRHLQVEYATGFKVSYIDEPVAIIAQGNIIQIIEEDVCNSDLPCSLSDCVCNEEKRTAQVIVITTIGFIASTINVRACVARDGR